MHLFHPPPLPPQSPHLLPSLPPASLHPLTLPPLPSGALCGLLDFLRDALLDRAVMSLGRVEALPQLTRVRGGEGGRGGGHR